MQLQQRINAFEKLGKIMSDIAAEEDSEVIRKASNANSWFSDENIRFALINWSEALQKQHLEKWLSAYDFGDIQAKNIGIVMAGNIPLVGFHDFISVLITGHKVIAKLSSNDTLLLPYLTSRLLEIEPEFESKIEFTEDRLQGFDAVIATGSNNTARYFDYYFGKYPNIIRKNRNSVAVLSGDESEEQLRGLADDIFRYFGLGCRNVSKLFVPRGFNFDPFFKAMFNWKEVINDNRYMNNYDYNKAVYLMSNVSLLDNEFMLLKEDEGYSSPISVVYYEYYDSSSELQKKLQQDKDEIQAVASNLDLLGAIPLGTAQRPQLWDYADGVDTVDFLLKLS